MTNRSDLLGRIPLFSGLTAERMAALSALTEEKGFPAGEEIITVGEDADALYILLEGSVQVVYPGNERDVELARLGPGDCFGEMALLNDQPRSASVRTLEPVRVLLLPREGFRDLLRSSADVSLNLLEVLSRRIRDTGLQMSGLSDQALRDPLTDLLNRRAFQERIREEANRNHRYGDEFSLILLDVDRFKAVNDTLGHHVGDEILRWLARVLKEHTRAADTPFRVGGEEFAILAPASGPTVARTVADRIRSTIDEARPPLDQEVTITVSGGYVSCPEHGRHPEHLFQLADRALYRAKVEGRNRIADPEEPAALA